jgi:hypothetical protein
MNTSNTPGFTGEASISGIREGYRTLRSSLAQAPGGGVLPQFCYTNLEGRVTECCYCYQGDCLCLPRKNLLTLSQPGNQP